MEERVLGLSWIYCLTLWQPVRLQQMPIFTGIGPKFSDSQDQTLRKSCTASWKRLRKYPSFHFHMKGRGPFSRHKSQSHVPSGTIPLWMYQRPALQQDCWMTQFHGWPQIIKLDGAHHFLFCLPRSYQVTWAGRHTHLDSTAPHPSKHFIRPDLMGGQLVLLNSEIFIAFIKMLYFMQILRINVSQ